MLLRQRLAAYSGIALLGLLAAAFVACAGSQGIGERCDFARAGDADCQSGLVCVQASDLGQNGDVCCPSDRTQKTGTICDGKGTSGGDAGADTGSTDAADTGAADTATSDTSTSDSAAADTGAADTSAADTSGADTSASDSATSDTAADASDAG